MGNMTEGGRKLLGLRELLDGHLNATMDDMMTMTMTMTVMTTAMTAMTTPTPRTRTPTRRTTEPTTAAGMATELGRGRTRLLDLCTGRTAIIFVTSRNC